MDREAWQAIVHGVTMKFHDFIAKQQHFNLLAIYFL